MVVAALLAVVMSLLFSLDAELAAQELILLEQPFPSSVATT
jgi:hypothetical protein